MTAALSKDTNMDIDSALSQPVSEMDYRRAVEEFDHLWETSTTVSSQCRMEELLRQIEAYEGTNTAKKASSRSNRRSLQNANKT